MAQEENEDSMGWDREVKRPRGQREIGEYFS